MLCRICEQSGEHPRYRASEMMFGTRQVFEYFQCVACKCLQVSEYPDDLENHYGASYYSYGPQASGSFIERAKTRLRDRYEISGRGRIGRYLSERGANHALRNLALVLGDRDFRILDVGCGSGVLLRQLNDIGFRRLTGADPFLAEDIRVSRRCVIYKKELSDLEGPFDVIMLNHSLEQMRAQQTVFYRIAERLDEGGSCVVRVPLASSYAWEHYGVEWVQLDAPRHLYLHTPDSLVHLAEKAGLRLIHTTYDSTAFQFWGSEQYKRGISLYDSRSFLHTRVAGSIFSRDEMMAYHRRAAELNDAARGDQAIFFFSKSLPKVAGANWP